MFYLCFSTVSVLQQRGKIALGVAIGLFSVVGVCVSFLTTLSFEDLQRLRECVRKVYMSNYERRHISDFECDKMIDALGQKVLEKEVKRLVDRKGAAGIDGGFLLPDDVPDITEAETEQRAANLRDSMSAHQQRVFLRRNGER
jgi:uncharacterized protein YnzC (UPF0291/DUF896 family)